MPVDYLDPGDEEAFALADDASASDEEDYADDGDGSDDDNASGSEDSFDADSDTHGAMDTSGHSHGKFGKHSHDGDGSHADAPMKGAKAMSERRAKSSADADEPRTLAEFRAAYAEHARQLAELREAKYLAEVKDAMAGFDRTFKFDEVAISGAPTQDPAGGKPAARSASVTPSRRLRRGLESFLLSEDARQMSDGTRASVLKLVQLAYEHGAVPLTSLALSETEQQPRRTVVAPGTARRGVETGEDAVKLAESKALARYSKPLSALANAERALLLSEAAAEAGYAGAATRKR